MNSPRPSVLLFWVALASVTALKAAECPASELVILGLFEQTGPVLVNSSANTNFTPGNGFGAGFQFATRLLGRIELELGASYTQRSWNDSVSGNLLMPAFDFPVGLRLRIFQWLALDAGGYYSSMNGTTRVDYISTVDYGVYGGGQLMIPLGLKAALFLGGRYLYGLANVSQVGGQLSFRGFEAIAGYQFNLSGSQNR